MHTNIDTPYVKVNYGVPELGYNLDVFELPFLTFSTNLSGTPDSNTRGDIPWASLDSEVNPSGFILAPGYAFDDEAQGYVGLSFNMQTYPGLKELAARQFEAFRERVYAARPVSCPNLQHSIREREMRGFFQVARRCKQRFPGFARDRVTPAVLLRSILPCDSLLSQAVREFCPTDP